MNAAAIELRGVCFAYDRHLVLEDVTLDIAPLDFVSIIGPNGGGKTTLLKLLLGLLEPSRGSVRVFGKPPREARMRIGYMPQHTQLDPLFPATALDVALMGRLRPGITFGARPSADRAAAMRALAAVGLDDRAAEPFSNLSGGQKQRVLIARALTGDPQLLLLDEPTSNLDIHIESELFSLLREMNQRMTIVLVSHDVGFVSQLVRTVVCVNRKAVIHPTSEVTPELIHEAYHGDARAVRHEHHG